MEALWKFVEKCCVEQGIDESHGLKHAKACVEWVTKLLLDEDDVTEDERLMAIYAAALHDMCDKKYTDVDKGLLNIRQWLLQQGWSLDKSDILLNIINTTSYSKLKRAMVNGKIVFPDHGAYNRVYHIVRHADLLDAYLVGRCILYQQHISPNILDEECWAIARALFDVRVFPYVRDGWITLPVAVAYAKELEKEAIRCFDTKTYSY
jgi:hypothetical protein